MDKLVIQLFGDILYHKGILNADEYESLLDTKCVNDLNAYMERMYRGEFDAYKRGEHYTASTFAE